MPYGLDLSSDTGACCLLGASVTTALTTPEQGSDYVENSLQSHRPRAMAMGSTLPWHLVWTESHECSL